MPTPYELVQTLNAAKAEHNLVFAAAAAHDGCPADAPFVCFSDDNPHAEAVNAAALAVCDAHNAVEAEKTRLGVHAFGMEVVRGAQAARHAAAALVAA